ncbi:MAG: enoyl-CoA hydratase/isomerase family protein, partial [Chloroflexi bacterium]|nr:enoyl-CoA hydratase/isomerase family protein [Chloroflexota bacterium]
MKELQLKTDRMLAHVENGVGWITFNQPQKRNAVSFDMWLAIPEIVSEFAGDGDVRVVVMKGAGDKAFVAGADISEFEDKRSSTDAVEKYEQATAAAHAALKSLEKPLIAMIRGFCIGGGLAIALDADLRVSADDGQFAIPAARLGVGYGYRGIRELVQLVGPSYAKEIFFTARRFSAQEAREMGLVNRVLPAAELESQTRQLAETIAGNAPLTVRAAKAAVGEATREPHERDFARIEAMVAECFASQDYIEGRRAFMEKRAPRFTG